MDDAATLPGLEIAGLRARPGEKLRQWVKLADDAAGPLNLPMILIAGTKPGPTLYVNSGLHGDEYDGLEAALRVADLLDPKAIAGNVIICPRANVPAYIDGFRFSSIDGLDLNRVFPGRADGFLTEQIAHFLSTRILPNADAIIDLHGGTTQLAVVSYGGWSSVDGFDALELAQLLGVKHLFDWSETLGKRPTMMKIAKELGIPCVVCEIGGANTWTEASVEDGVHAVMNTLRYLGMIEGDFTNQKDEVLVLTGGLTSSPAGGFLRPKCALGDWVKQGQVVAEIVSLLGEKLCEITAPFDGVVNDIRTMPRIRPGEWLYMYGKLQRRLRPNPAAVARKNNWRRRK